LRFSGCSSPCSLTLALLLLSLLLCLQEAWDAYSACEKKPENKDLYKDLKNNSDACKSAQKSGAC
jgi:hypothetical protein